MNATSKIGYFFLAAIIILSIAACQQVDTTASQPPPTAVSTPVTTVTSTPVEIERIETAVTPMDLFLRVTEVVVTVIPPQPAQTPQPPPQSIKTLRVCQAAEPDSLFVFGTKMLDGDNIQHAIYENLYTMRSYGYQAQGLEKLPSFADGDAKETAVPVQMGDWVVDAANNVVRLAEGVMVKTATGEMIIFDGTPIEMVQLSADFTLKPLVWSDGTPASADDSVFGFEVNQQIELPSNQPVQNQELLERTAVYEATGDLTLRWQGLPGYFDATYFLNVWPLLPRHQLGERPLESFVDDPDVIRTPLATGPFVVHSWQSGSQIILSANPHYYRQAEGLPNVDQVIFKFLFDSEQILEQTSKGACHIATGSSMNVGVAPAMMEAESNGLLDAHFLPSSIFEHLSFGINSHSDYGDGNGRPDWFEDVRVRQAFAHCLDRQQIANEVLFDQGVVVHSYLPSMHPLADVETLWPFDLAKGNELLDEAGFIDTNGDGVREAADGTPFELELVTTLGAQLRPDTADQIAAGLMACGIVVEPTPMPAGDFFTPAPSSPLYGRQFDLALFGWGAGHEPPCYLWLEVADDVEPERHFNFTGWQNEEFTTACQTAMSSYAETAEYIDAHQTAVAIFTQELPALPLFSRIRVSVSHPDVLNFQPNASQPSELWNLFELDIGE